MESKEAKKRSRIEINADMLGVCKDGAKKTHILYRCNLSYFRLKSYLKFLMDAGLLEERKRKSGEVIYFTTGKGKDFLSNYEKLSNTLDFKRQES